MPHPLERILAGEAAHRLGVSVKALRLYEQHGLLQPARSEAGYRRYGPDDLLKARDVVALRSLGLGLTRIAKVLDGDLPALDEALKRREGELGHQFAAMRAAGERLRELRQRIASGKSLRAGELAQNLRAGGQGISFDLPWPWGGEPFLLEPVAPLTYLVGPLGSGKTRLALRLAEALPNAVFLGLARFEDPARFEQELRLSGDESHRVESHLDWLREEGASGSLPLRCLLAALEAQGGRHPLFVDMIEEGLTRASQEALMPLLRRLVTHRVGPVIAMTRSSSILNASDVGPNEAIVYCPANHSAPLVVPPFEGATGYESLQSCLATPEARQRLTRAPACAA